MEKQYVFTPVQNATTPVSYNYFHFDIADMIFFDYPYNILYIWYNAAIGSRIYVLGVIKNYHGNIRRSTGRSAEKQSSLSSAYAMSGTL